MQRQSLQRIGYIMLFFLLAISCTLLDIHMIHDSRIMMKWFGCCGVILLLAFLQVYVLAKQRIHVRIVDLAVVIFLLYILGADYFRNELSEPVILRMVCLGLMYLVFRQSIEKSSFDICMGILFAIGFALAIWGIAQFVLAVLHHQPLHTAVTASFDNPAGYALALSLTFAIGIYLLTITNLHRWQCNMVYVALAAIVMALILSFSRTGWLSVLCVSAYAYCSYGKRSRRRWVLSLLVVVVLLAFFYFVKQDSADGRSYIAICTSQQIADAPWLGHGRYGFSRAYMDYQAAYLDAHPDSRFMRLADNTHHPFNEWLHLAVRYGLIGVLLVVIVLLSLGSALRHCIKLGYSPLLGILIALFPFTLFSYPMQYPLAWVMLIMVIAFLAKYSRCLYTASYSMAVPLTLLLCACTASPLLYRAVRAEVVWYDVATRSLSGQTRYVMPRYEELYTHLRHSPHFLYNYAAELNYIGEYHRSQQVLSRCMKRMNDYDTHLLAASNHEHMGNYGLAEAHLRKASAMCPVRFVPLYQLAKLYGKMGRYEDQRQMAQQIMDKEVKVSSPRITEMKDEMRYILEETDFK